MTMEHWNLDYSRAANSDIFQREVGIAAVELVRRRTGQGFRDPTDPSLFFGAVSDIAQEFYDSYAPDCKLDGFLKNEVMECVTFAVSHITHGRTEVRM